MFLPELPPDISFVLLSSDEVDMLFALAAKHEAMGPHIEAKWGWDEAYQLSVHKKHYEEKPFYKIVRSGEAVGTLSIQCSREYMRFGEFYLFKKYQGKGLGTLILRHCLEFAEFLKLPVRLEYLHWNPVGSLYKRHGFTEIGQSDIHVFMERPFEAKASS